MRYSIFFIIAGLMVIGSPFRVWAEDTHMHHQHSMQESSVETGQVEDAGNTFCPITGEEVDKHISYVYEGRRYYFCCPWCIEEFKKEPEKYIAKMEKMQMAAGTQHHQMLLSGQLKDGVRVVEVRAFKYGFDPDPIVVRKGDRVKFEATSGDVAHGLAIKDFGINISVPPGKISSVEFTADRSGEFEITCSVYCGPGHNKMKAKLIVQ